MVTMLREVATNRTLEWDTELARDEASYDHATAARAEQLVRDALRSGGSVLKKETADAPYKSTTRFAPEAHEQVILPRVAGG